MDRSPTRDFIVGCFVLCGILAIAYLSIGVGGYNLERKPNLKLSASFDETGSLSLRAPVVIAGVRVGEVSAISLGQDFRANVDMQLDSALKLPTDTSAAIVTAGVLGDRFIEIQPGGEDKILKSGDRITYTESAVILEKLIGQLIYGKTKSADKENKSADEKTAIDDPFAPKPAKAPTSAPAPTTSH